MNFFTTKKRSLIKLQSLFLVASLFIASFSFADNTFFTAPLTQIADLGYGKDVYLVKDAQEKQFILKYNTKCFVSTSETSIHEALGAKIGMVAGIPINDVRIFAPYDTSLGCVDCYPHLSKTLHTVVPGKIAYYAEVPYDVHIQYTGPETLTSFTHHIDLCKIGALDLFTSNVDRHNGNLFFDKQTNHFYAIDMDWIFAGVYDMFNGKNNASQSSDDKNKYDTISLITSFLNKLREAIHGTPYIGKTAITCDLLAPKVYAFLKNLDPKNLSEKEIEALKEINATLYTLQTMYPPRKLYAEWMKIAQEAHYTYNSKKQQYIRYLIAYNHREITKIRAQINRLILGDTNNTVSAHAQHLKDRIAIAYQNILLKMHTLKITFNNYQTT